jgi:hypothetical protein
MGPKNGIDVFGIVATCCEHVMVYLYQLNHLHRYVLAVAAALEWNSYNIHKKW